MSDLERLGIKPCVVNMKGLIGLWGMEDRLAYGIQYRANIDMSRYNICLQEYKICI